VYVLKSAIFILVAGFVLFEIVEHVVFPLIWSIKDRRKRSVCGASGMLGEVGKIRYWGEFDGQVFVHGELWRAVSGFRLSEGDSVVVQKVNGLTVTVAPVEKADMSRTDRISKKTAL
jgi:membrane-bound ClpP family serine protease